MKQAKYEIIYIERYNNGERNFKREHTVFDSFETEDLLGEEKAFEIYQLYAEKAKLFIQDSLCVDITRIQINLNDLDNELNALANEVYEHSKRVGGDDDSYDYFPDLVYAFRQICQAVKRFDVYNEVAMTLNERLNYNEDDELFIASFVN